MADTDSAPMETQNSHENGLDCSQNTNKTRNESRLMITKIVNENFKSYAGIQELGPFHKSFSSIVGPNGSGKSNVIDAMLFVFGYRSKMIRTKKVSQLIHNSSAHPNVTACTVSVHFQKIIDLEGEKFEAIPNSEFVVSRTARKDNSSDYYINGRKTPFKDVAALLRASGIDLDHNRFLILQGEVEQISMMKPKALTEHEDGMLEYLEDIIGSSKYKEPIEELAKEVEVLNEARGEKLNRVKAVEKEKEELQGSKDEAVEYINMENNFTKKKNILYQIYIHECTVNEERAAAKRDEVKTGFDELHKVMSDITDRKKAKGKEHKKLQKQYEELCTTAEETKKNFSAFERDDLKLREDYKHAKQNVKKLQKSLEKEKEKLDKLTKEPEANQKQVENLTEKMKQLEEQKVKEEEKLAEVMESLKTETQGLQVEKEAKEETLMEKNKVVNEAKSKMDVAKSELDVYKSQHDSAMSQLREARNNLEAAIQKSQQRNNEIKSIDKELPELKKSLADTEKELNKAVQGEEKAAGELRSLRSKVEEARSSLQASRSRGNVLEALMKQKETGKIKGIYGRLGDLGAIDDKYDVAISTACGALDHIVCDTMETAQQCVQYLKKNNIGAATFIGLDKVEVWRKDASSKISTPDNAPRLYDLVRVKDKKVSTAFFFALRNTLVADDLEKATKTAFQGSKRWRVVTLQGQLIDQSGTMSGGGTRVAKGRMCSSFVSDVSPQQLVDMEKKLELNQQEMEKHRESKKNLEVTVDELNKKVKTLVHQLEKNKMEVAALKEQEATLNEQIVHLKKEVEKTTPDEAKLKELETSLEKFQKEWNKASTAASKIENEVQSLNKKIMDIGGAKLKGQQTRVDTAVKAIDEIQGQITKASVAIKTSQRNIKKSEDKVASLEKEIVENDDSIKQMDVEFVTLEEKATKVLEDFQAAEKHKKEMEELLQKTNGEYTAVEAEENELRSKEVDLKHEVEKLETVYKENHQKVRHWQKELSKLSLQTIGLTDQQEDSTLPTLTPEDLDKLDKAAVSYEMTLLDEKLNQMKPNMAVIAEYRKKEEAYLARVRELDQVTSDRDDKRREHEALRKKRLDEFMAGFTIITTKLKEMYQMITLGGDAELELVDSLDPFSEGIVFSVRPPKKSWKNISNLSGGEKTLSSLALVFALHHFKPTPLYVMDEIDAALDFRNVSIVANYIKERTKNAQFIIISLRNNMFELADRLVGIYKTHDCTKSVTINPKLIAHQG